MTSAIEAKLPRLVADDLGVSTDRQLGNCDLNVCMDGLSVGWANTPKKPASTASFEGTGGIVAQLDTPFTSFQSLYTGNFRRCITSFVHMKVRRVLHRTDGHDTHRKSTFWLTGCQPRVPDVPYRQGVIAELEDFVLILQSRLGWQGGSRSVAEMVQGFETKWRSTSICFGARPAPLV